MKNRHVIGITLALIVLLILAGREISLLPDGKLHLYLLDIGQGDSILLVTPAGRQVLIDGGPDMSALEKISKYMPFFDRKIELLVLTHPDSDHITSFPDLMRRYKTEYLMFSGIIHEQGRYEDMLNEIKKQQIKLISPDPGTIISLGDGVKLDVIWPPAGIFGVKPENVNDTSVVLRLIYKDHSVLLTGDIEEKVENQILQSGVDLKSDILKVPHHGSRTSSSTGFLLAVDPDLAIISAGRDNEFGHPHRDVLERYRNFGIPVRLTAGEGTLSLVFE